MSEARSENADLMAEEPPKKPLESEATARPDDDWMRHGLHDLCQPLMALECLLFVNREPVEGESLDASVLRGVIQEGLVECQRMLVLMQGMQQRMT